MVKYCGFCKRYVTPEKKFRIGTFLGLSLISFGLLGVAYMIFYFTQGGKCPICNSTNWSIPEEE